MKLILKGVHIELSDQLKAEVADQLWSSLDHIIPGDNSELEVHLVDSNGPKGGNDQECRVTVRLPNRPSVHVTEVSDNMYKSIRLCADRLDRVFKRQMDLLRLGTHVS